MPISCGARASLRPPVRPRLVVMKPPRTRIGTIFATLNSGDAVLGRDIGSLDVLAAGERAMDQNPEGVAGLLGQSHGSDIRGAGLYQIAEHANSFNLGGCTRP